MQDLIEKSVILILLFNTLVILIHIKNNQLNIY